MNSRDKLLIILSEIRYQFGMLIQLPRESARLRQEEERKLLRRLLRRTPFWISGHARLGMVEAALESKAAGARDPRAVAAIRVSAKAVLQLVQSQSLSELEAKRYHLQASYLLGVGHFLFREFEKAADFFHEILDPAQADYVSLELGLSTMEYAGSTALALGDEEGARRYFAALPEGRRSVEVDSALG